MIKLANLIFESEVLTLIEGNPTESEIDNIFLHPSMKKLSQYLAAEIHKCINNYAMEKPHFYRLKLQVHAQEKEIE